MGLAESVESALGRPRSAPAKDEYRADNEAQAIELIRHSASQGRLASATVKEEQPAQGGLAASVMAALSSSAKPSAPSSPSAPTPQAQAAKPAQQPEMNSDRQRMERMGEHLGPIKGMAETAGNVVSGIGTSLIGGWRGLAELARGGTLKDAVEAVHGQDANALARTYEPQTKEGQVGAEVMASNYNPINWPSAVFKASAGNAADRTGSPALATAIETGGNALMLGLPAAFKKPAVPLAKPRLVGPAAEIADKPRITGPAADVSEARVPEFVPPVAAGAGKALPAAEQSRRVQILRRVGVENTRRSAVEGDTRAAADDFQQSKLTNEGGTRFKETLEHEKQALSNHAEKIVQETGGTTGLDETARAGRGQTIIEPLDKLKQWFDTKTTNLYKAANEKAKGVPVELQEVHDLVKNNRADFLGTVEGKQLLEGVNERMKSLGMLDKEGNPLPVTVAQAERLNQYLGNQWTPRTGRLIRDLKDSILEGVTKNAGEDIYREARAVRSMRASTLDDPKGIAKIMDASGPEGINRSVPTEKIANEVSGMPLDHMKHVVRVLKNVPKELQPEARAALGEIKAHFANKVLEIGSKQQGQWNAKGVTKYLQENSAKLKEVFTPDELARLQDLNEAGHILAKDQSYPGAAVQEHNLLTRGAMHALRGTGAATGGALLGAPGAAAGAFVGDIAAKNFGEGAALRSAQKRLVKLSDFPK